MNNKVSIIGFIDRYFQLSTILFKHLSKEKSESTHLSFNYPLKSWDSRKYEQWIDTFV